MYMNKKFKFSGTSHDPAIKSLIERLEQIPEIEARVEDIEGELYSVLWLTGKGTEHNMARAVATIIDFLSHYKYNEVLVDSNMNGI